MPPTSQECLTSVKALLQFLSALPHAWTDATSAFQASLQAYVQIRTSYVTATLEPLSQHVVQVAASVQAPSVPPPREVHVAYQRGAAPVERWLRALLGLWTQENAALSTLCHGMQWDGQRPAMAAAIAEPLLSAASATLQALLPRQHHGLSAHRWLALDVVAQAESVLGPDAARWTDAWSSVPGAATHVANVLAAARDDACAFLPELLQDIQLMPVQNEHEALRVQVSDLARLGTALLRGLAAYQDVIMRLLGVRGHPTWVSHAPQPEGTAPADALWAAYTKDLLSAVTTALERTYRPPLTQAPPPPSHSRRSPQSSCSSTWHASRSNLAYVEAQIHDMASVLAPGAAAAAMQPLSAAMRTARTHYLGSWDVVVQALVEAPTPRTGPMAKMAVLGDRSRPDPLAYVGMADAGASTRSYRAWNACTAPIRSRSHHRCATRCGGTSHGRST